MKKQSDLKKRLDELRYEPEPPVEVTLYLDADLCRLLKTLSAGEDITLEAYLVQAIVDHAEKALGDGDE